MARVQIQKDRLKALMRVLKAAREYIKFRDTESRITLGVALSDYDELVK